MTEVQRFGPTRRGGPVFRWLGEPLAIDLANTVMVVRDGGEQVDLLAGPADLERWLGAERERLGGYAPRPGDLDRVRELRDAARELLTARATGETPPPHAVSTVNSASEAAPHAPLLDAGGGLVKNCGFDSPAELLGTLARATIELLTGPGGERLQVCRAPSCGMFYLGTRRWCCSACGNRARAARHYERQRARR